MNIYKKLQTAKVKLLNCNISKTGKNKFSNYDYFELGDFLPQAIMILDEIGLTTYITFNQECATLHVINNEAPEESLFITSPMSSAELKGMHAIQNLGAVQTYQRRYLYLTLFDISENDFLDSVAGKDKPKTAPKNNDVVYYRETAPKSIQDDISMLLDDDEEVISKQDVNQLFKLCYINGVANWKPLNELTKKYGYNKTTEIRYRHYQTILSELKQTVSNLS